MTLPITITGNDEIIVEVATMVSPPKINVEATILPIPVPNTSIKIPPRKGTTVFTKDTAD